MMDITERDWKRWKRLRQTSIDQFCHTTFEQVRQLSEKEGPVHDRHRELYRIVHERDEEIVDRFDPHTRSRAIMQLLHLYQDDLITDNDVEQFSEELCHFLKERKTP